jgi:hypothetical protein
VGAPNAEGPPEGGHHDKSGRPQRSPSRLELAADLAIAAGRIVFADGHALVPDIVLIEAAVADGNWPTIDVLVEMAAEWLEVVGTIDRDGRTVLLVDEADR